MNILNIIILSESGKAGLHNVHLPLQPSQNPQSIAKIATCFPDTCSSANVTSLLKKLPDGFNYTNARCVQENKPEWSAKEVVAL